VSDPLLGTLARVLGLEPEDVDEQTTMKDCGAWDSLKHLQLIMAMEQAFGVRFATETIPELVSVVRIREEIARLTA
jgi:acyl carrier protein